MFMILPTMIIEILIKNKLKQRNILLVIYYHIYYIFFIKLFVYAPMLCVMSKQELIILIFKIYIQFNLHTISKLSNHEVTNNDDFDYKHSTNIRW